MVLETPVASLWHGDKIERSRYSLSHTRYVNTSKYQRSTPSTVKPQLTMKSVLEEKLFDALLVSSEVSEGHEAKPLIYRCLILSIQIHAYPS